MSIAAITDTLAFVEADDTWFHLQGSVSFGQHLAALCAIPTRDLVGCLLTWRIEHRDGLWLLYDAVADSDEASDHVAAALVYVLSQMSYEPDPMENVLVRAFPRIPAPQRNWVANWGAVASRLGLVAGRDFERVWELSEQDTWPEDTPLPPGDTVAGLQARIQLRNLNPGPVTGHWNPTTRAALYRLQFEGYHPSPGAVDAETLELLDVEADAMERARQRHFELIEGPPGAGA